MYDYCHAFGDRGFPQPKSQGKMMSVLTTVHGNQIKLICGDVTQQSVDAIGNAANSQLAGGGGGDGGGPRHARITRARAGDNRNGACR